MSKSDGSLSQTQRISRKAIKAVLTDIGKRHLWFMAFYKRMLYLHGRRKYNQLYSLPVNEKMVLFESFKGRQFSCSPKAVYLKMLNDERFSDYTFVWSFKRPQNFAFLAKNKNTILVTQYSREYYSYIAQSKYYVMNSRLNDIINKKDEQIFIQCWHGTPLKKLGCDIDVKGGNALYSRNEIQRTYRSDGEKYNYMISPSDFSTEKFASAFALKDKSIIQTIGYPRNDFLLNFTAEDVESIKKKLSIFSLLSDNKYKDIDYLRKLDKLQFDFDKKIILYAPTWRDNQHEAGTGYTYELGINFDRMKEELGDDYIILFRTHYFVANQIDLSPYEGFVYDVSKYDDINELYAISDILITDYSSVFFDFANLKRPILYYMYDFEEYKNEMRDFYIDLSELPGPIVKTEDDLITELKNIDSYNDKYAAVYETFNAKYNYLDDGKATDRLIEKCILQK